MSLLPQSDASQPAAQIPGVAAPADAAVEVTEPFEFPGLRDRLSRVWTRYLSKPGTFLLLSLLAAAAPAVGVGIAVAVSAGSLAIMMATRQVGLVTLATYLGILAVTGLLYSYVLAAIAAAGAFKIRAGRALGVGLRNMLPLALAFLLASFVLAIPSIVIIPAIIIGLRYALIAPVVTTERRYGIESLARSRDLVYGNTKKLFVEMLILAVVTALVNAMVGGLLSFVGGAMNSMTAALWLPVAGTALCTSLTVPFWALYTQVFYEDCVALKGADWAPNPGRTRLSGVLAALGGIMFALAFAAPAVLSSMTGSAAPGAVTGFPSTPVDTNANVAVNVAPPPPPAPKEPTPEERDLERYGDVNTVKIALAGYYSDEREYPATLILLEPKYLSEVPTDPLTEDPYSYARDGLSYKLTFTLEAGVFALAQGDHFLTPQGFDVEPVQSLPPENSGTVVTTVPSTDPPPEPVIPEPEQPEVSAPPDAAAPQDTDGDGLADADEASLGTDSAKADTDGDGLNDGEEVRTYASDPLVADTDDDGFTDGSEVYGGYDPTKAGASRLPDIDEDGLADAYEQLHSLDPQKKDADGDGLSDGDELRVYRTDPNAADTDGDGFTDPQELQRGYEPNGEGLLSDERKQQIDADAMKYGLF